MHYHHFTVVVDVESALEGMIGCRMFSDLVLLSEIIKGNIVNFAIQRHLFDSKCMRVIFDKKSFCARGL